MDSVRFGRALGIGARLAARTLVTAVDAATAPNPSARSPAGPAAVVPPRTRSAPTLTPVPHMPANATRTAQEVRGTTRGIARGTRRFTEAVWGPFARLSGVLWLELTGVFFGLFALSAAVAAWKLRDNFHTAAGTSGARLHLELAGGIALLFGYFCVSSFVRASRRERRR